jgi:hypothetical protein
MAGLVQVLIRGSEWVMIQPVQRKHNAPTHAVGTHDTLLKQHVVSKDPRRRARAYGGTYLGKDTTNENRHAGTAVRA